MIRTASKEIDIGSVWIVAIIILITAIGIGGYVWNHYSRAEAAPAVSASGSTFVSHSSPQPNTLSAY